MAEFKDGADIHVTAEERLEFLSRHGWKKGMGEDEWRRLNKYWSDTDIRMATDLGLG